MTVTPSSNKLCDFKFSIFRSRDNPDSSIRSRDNPYSCIRSRDNPYSCIRSRDISYSSIRSRDNPDSENEEEGEGGGGETIGHWSAEIEEMDISKVNVGILRDKTMANKLMFIPSDVTQN